jgi:hypothetical protein
MPGLKHVALLGDFTLDNQVATKKKWCAWRETSVVEHLKALMPEDEVVLHDHSQGTARVQDILNNKFKPDTESYAAIQQANTIVVSMGATDLQYLLNHVFVELKGQEDRKEFVEGQIDQIMSCMRANQKKLIEQVRGINETARIIVMTHPYLASNQQTYDMQALGKFLNIGGPLYDPGEVMRELMKNMVQPLVTSMHDSNVMVLDVTSSLNPYDGSNYADQLEPSGTGGKKIAQMLTYMMTHDDVHPGFAYRFFPKFFYGKEEGTDVSVSALNTWTLASPYDLREGYFAEEEAMFMQYDIANQSIDELLEKLNQAISGSSIDAMKKAGLRVYNVVDEKQKLLAAGGEKQLKMSVVLATDVISHPTRENIALLKKHADCSSMGKPGSVWNVLQDALLMLVGAALLGAGLGMLGTAAGCGFIAAGMFGMYSHRRQGPSSATLDVAHVADTALQPAR